MNEWLKFLKLIIPLIKLAFAYPIYAAMIIIIPLLPFVLKIGSLRKWVVDTWQANEKVIVYAGLLVLAVVTFAVLNIVIYGK